MVVLFGDSQNSTKYDSVSELSKIELPVHSKRRRITTCFNSWTPVCTTEYTEALKIPSKFTSHTVWKFKAGHSEFVVPALALMRAIFRPHPILLAQLFRPQAIDGICIPTTSGFVFTKNWHSLANRDKTTSLLNPIEWIWSYPSAKKMSSSLYQFALRGELGMLLPLAKMRATVYGQDIGNIFYVTKIAIATIEPKEAHSPLFYTEKHIFIFNNSYKSHEKHKIKQNANYSLPTHQGGDWKVSDEEWAILERHFKNDRPPVKYDRRTMLNGILKKLCTGLSWRKCNYEVGTFITASKQYLYWKNNGTLKKIEEIILKRNPSHINKYRKIQYARYHPLSDLEWESIHKLLQTETGAIEFRNQNHRKYSHRYVVDEILARAIEGKPWGGDLYGTNRIQSIYETYLKWRKNGILKIIIAEFNLLRPQAEVSQGTT